MMLPFDKERGESPPPEVEHELYVTIPSTQAGFLSSLLALSYSMTQKRPLLTAFLSYTLVLSDSLITQLLYT